MPYEKGDSARNRERGEGPDSYMPLSVGGKNRDRGGGFIKSQGNLNLAYLYIVESSH